MTAKPAKKAASKAAAKSSFKPGKEAKAKVTAKASTSKVASKPSLTSVKKSSAAKPVGVVAPRPVRSTGKGGAANLGAQPPIVKCEDPDAPGPVEGVRFDNKDVVGAAPPIVKCEDPDAPSSVSLAALAPFLIENGKHWINDDLKLRFDILVKDIESLREYDGQLSSEIGFLLDSTVGLIGYEQNQSMKVLSVAALLIAFV